MILEKWGKNEVSLANASAWIEFLVTVLREGIQAEPSALPGLRRWTWESKKTKAAISQGRALEKRELHRDGKRSRELQRAPLESKAEYSSAHACEDTIQGWAKQRATS